MLLSTLALPGCAREKQEIAGLTCDDVEDMAVDSSDGRLIKITGASETSRTARELICHGTGFYRSGNLMRTRYRAWRDEDGEIMFAWDTEEANDEDWKQTVATAERENERDDRLMEERVDNVFAHQDDQ